MKVSVLGGGNGGSALAFHLVQMGHEVLLYQRNNILKETRKIIAVKETEGIKSVLHGVSPISKTTSCMKEAVNFSEYIMLVVPAFAQSVIFKSALPYLTKDHVFVSMPGNFAFLDYMKVMHDVSSQQGYPVVSTYKNLSPVKAFVELSTIPYACRLLDKNKVFIGGLKSLMHVGVFPSYKTDTVVNSLKPFFDKTTLEKNQNVIETGFCNLNFILHPPTIIFNAGWIESTKGDFLFYKQGLTPRVAHAMETLDKERIAVAASIGITVEDIVTTWRKWYGINNLNSMAEIPEKGKPYQFVKAPENLDNRFIWEDIQYMLLPIIKYLAKQNNVPTPLSDALITSTNVIIGRELKPARHFYGSLDEYANI